MLLTSVFKSNEPTGIIIHCIADVQQRERTAFESFIKSQGAEIHFYEIDSMALEDFKGTLTGDWSVAVYFKMAIPGLVGDSIEKLVYLDSDTLVVGSLRGLFDQNLEDFPIAAVYDNYVRKQELIGIVDEGNYFNSGVMLINIKEWKKQNISQRAFEFLQSNPSKILFVDQDALNRVLAGNWKKLDPKFNLLYSYIPPEITKREMDSYLSDKVIIHFTLQKPWSMLCRNRLRYLYADFHKLSPIGNTRVISDFTIRNLSKLFRIRLVEFYFDSPTVRKIWRRMKRSSKEI